MNFQPKRWLFLIHRWLGIAVALFFACWFFSGMVMMYVGYPKLSETERLSHLPPLSAHDDLLAPGAALERAGVTAPLADLRLSASSAGQPVYLATPQPAEPAPQVLRRPPPSAIAIDARSGQRLPATNAETALASARAWMQAEEGSAARPAPAYLGTVDEDAHTHSRALDEHRPLHRVQLADEAGTLLYISSRTGAVVRDAPRIERAWNYVGTWLHWLYAFRGGALNGWWAYIIDTLATLGIVAVLTGAAVGVMRWRFREPYRTGRRSPYPQPMMRWHHVSGLLFALIALTWVFSGLMSMNPLRMFSAGSAPQWNAAALTGGPLTPDEAQTLAAPAALLAAPALAGQSVRELRWHRALGRTWATAHTPATPDTPGLPLLDARLAAPAALPAADLHAAARALLPAPAQVQELREYDFYYYRRADHTMTGGSGDRPLPVLRVMFDDPNATWLHLNPHTGQALEQSDRLRRASRWLFTLLHSWDWPPLLALRPLWDALMLALSLGGVALSLTGVVIGVRRLALKAAPARKAPKKPAPAAPAAAP